MNNREGEQTREVSELISEINEQRRLLDKWCGLNQRYVFSSDSQTRINDIRDARRLINSLIISAQSQSSLLGLKEGLADLKAVNNALYNHDVDALLERAKLRNSASLSLLLLVILCVYMGPLAAMFVSLSDGNSRDITTAFISMEIAGLLIAMLFVNEAKKFWPTTDTLTLYRVAKGMREERSARSELGESIFAEFGFDNHNKYASLDPLLFYSRDTAVIAMGAERLQLYIDINQQRQRLDGWCGDEKNQNCIYREDVILARHEIDARLVSFGAKSSLSSLKDNLADLTALNQALSGGGVDALLARANAYLIILPGTSIP